MGIFTTTETREKIPPEPGSDQKLAQVRDALHLTPEDVETHFHAQLGKEAYEHGFNYFKENANTFPNAPGINLGTLALEAKATDKAELVNSIYSQLDAMTPAMEQQLSPGDIKQLMVRKESFAKGYIQAAMDAKDWQTAIKSLDRIAAGGVTSKLDELENFANTIPDKETKLKMYELVATLIEKQSQPAQPTPKPAEVPTPVINQQLKAEIQPEKVSITPTSLNIPGEKSMPTSPLPENSPGPIPPILHTDGTPLRPAPPQPGQYNH